MTELWEAMARGDVTAIQNLRSGNHGPNAQTYADSGAHPTFTAAEQARLTRVIGETLRVHPNMTSANVATLVGGQDITSTYATGSNTHFQGTYFIQMPDGSIRIYPTGRTQNPIPSPSTPHGQPAGRDQRAYHEIPPEAAARLTRSQAETYANNFLLAHRPTEAQVLDHFRQRGFELREIRDNGFGMVYEVTRPDGSTFFMSYDRGNQQAGASIPHQARVGGVIKLFESEAQAFAGDRGSRWYGTVDGYALPSHLQGEGNRYNVPTQFQMPRIRYNDRNHTAPW
jgi:hypothetical protein